MNLEEISGCFRCDLIEHNILNINLNPRNQDNIRKLLSCGVTRVACASLWTLITLLFIRELGITLHLPWKVCWQHGTAITRDALLLHASVSLCSDVPGNYVPANCRTQSSCLHITRNRWKEKGKGNLFAYGLFNYGVSSSETMLRGNNIVPQAGQKCSSPELSF
jgi:hypothetical protein